MGELFSIKNLFICSNERSVEELRTAMEGLLKKERAEGAGGGEKEAKEETHPGGKKYEMIKDYLDANKNNVLHFAIYGNNMNNVEFIIENTNLINSINSEEQNGLIISVLNRNTQISKYLIEQNIDYNQKDKHKANALLYSLITQNYEIFNLLMEKKNIDINVNSFEKGNLLSVSIFERNIHVLKKLFNKFICPFVEGSVYPHPLLYITYSSDNELLFLYLTYCMYYCTKDDALYKINTANFDHSREEIYVDLDHRQVICSIWDNSTYDLSAFKDVLNMTDEDGTPLCSTCVNNGNSLGKNIFDYFSAPS
ncbi:conserved Plasmodium protein, unknown function [Plasmodium vivax]|uniref:Uncharacterized protein n=2 Tax=Plasmodium vivax TaxID=5855 RepID=A0A0J9TP55_PLAVI|nr:hypothetical protein PVNG_01935 [Plasmodium vivax North Korean]CAG9472530.1 unnamed protein product [Plasmodium vivax]SCO75697.1 conserved Plasmodium protein, unknown function [Plasmodium vivax]